MSILNIFKEIGKFIAKLLPWAKVTTANGLAVADEIKSIADNPVWDVVTSFTKTKLDDAALAVFRQFMANLHFDLRLTDQVLAIGANYKETSATIASMGTEAKAGTLNTIAAAANVKLAELAGKVMPIETALSIQQAAYFKPELLK